MRGMKAGFGKARITPPLGVELAGYGYYLERRARGVLDDLYARCLALECGGRRALVICCDVLGLRDDVCGEVRAWAEEQGIPGDAVMMVSVHTHTGPAVIYHEGTGYVNESYVCTLGGMICEAAREALEDLREVREILFGRADNPGSIAFNRAREDGPVDRQVYGFLIRREGEDLAILSSACHGVCRDRIPLISADFAGGVNRNLEEKGLKSIYLNGLCGDIDPRDRGTDALEAYARSQTDTFLAHLPGFRSCPLTMRTGCLSFQLNLEHVDSDLIRKAADHAVRDAGEGSGRARVARLWEAEMLSRLEALKDQETYEVRVLCLGGIPILALPCEGFTEIALRVRKASGQEDALVLGCADQLLGYVPTRDDYRRGAYAALESTFLYRRLPILEGEAERIGDSLGADLRVWMEA